MSILVRIAVAAAAGMLLLPVPKAHAAAGAPPTAAAAAAAAILVDVDTGRVLYADHVHQLLPPASLTKTLTAAIAAGWLPPGAQIPVTVDAFNAFPDKVGMKPGQKWPLTIALHALITDSANDAAYALAIDIAGSLPAFGAVMQAAARQMGMSDHPVLHDPAGLDGREGVQGGNLMSAWDLAIAGRDMMANPELAAIAAEHTFDFKGPDGIAYHLRSRNLYFLLDHPDAIGVKTGFTNAAGYCDMEEVVRGGRHMLAVVMHSNNPDALAESLITAGFTVPAAAEAGYPSLPPVTAPAPELPPAAATTTVDPPPRVAAVEPARPRGRQGTGLLDVIGAAGVVAGIGVWVRRWVRGRPPAGGHSRRS